MERNKIFLKSKFYVRLKGLISVIIVLIATTYQQWDNSITLRGYILINAISFGIIIVILRTNSFSSILERVGTDNVITYQMVFGFLMNRKIHNMDSESAIVIERNQKHYFCLLL